MEKATYIIRGGIEGRERLRILSRVLQPAALALLQRAGIRSGMAVLDIGCGGGDLAFDIARMVGPAGRVVGTDIDETKLALAREEAAELGLANVAFHREDVTSGDPEPEFDLVHVRFVLTHLADPAAAMVKIRGALRPGGVIVLEDIDFRGCFCYPESEVFRRWVELYTEAARRRGADANIGPRLPALLMDAGIVGVDMNVVQPAGIEGDVKLMHPITMENIADAVLAEGLASPAEVNRVIAELYEFARMRGTVMGFPRIVQAWGSCPSV